MAALTVTFGLSTHSPTILAASAPSVSAQDAVEVPDNARLEQWRALLKDYANAPAAEQLVAVNDFFNQLDFVEDELLWGHEDYWATPLEVLAVGAGDCEDMSIAKYFSLRRLGVPADSLRITYVKVPSRDMAHMVLSYYERPGAEPLVLDTLVADIMPASRRDDLEPVYSFDAASLWVAVSKHQERRVGEAGQLVAWKTLLTRVALEQEGSSASESI